MKFTYLAVGANFGFAFAMVLGGFFDIAMFSIAVGFIALFLVETYA